MNNATLTITNGDVSVNNIQFPSYLLDFTEDVKDYIEIKDVLARVFIEYYQTDDFKERDETEDVKMLHHSLNDMLDNLHLANLTQKAKEGRKEIEGMLGMSIEQFKKESEERAKTGK